MSKKKIHSHVLIVCEGPEDESFINSLIKKRSLPSCHVCNSGGWTTLAKKLDGIRPSAWFANIQKVLIIADNDDKPDKRFADICAQLEDFEFEAPSKPGELSKSGHPKICIWMMPSLGELGCLETLLTKPARNVKGGKAKEIDEFLAVVGQDKWTSDVRKSKAWLRAYLAINASDPGVTLVHTFTQSKNKNLFPLDDNSLTKFSNFISDFCGSQSTKLRSF